VKLVTRSVLLWLAVFTALIGWTQTPSTTWVPIELKNGYLVTAKGSVGGLNDLTFLVDTGTSRTLMDSHLAKRLQLAGVPDKLTVFDRDLRVELISPPDLRLGTIQADSPLIIATDLSSVAQRFGFHVDAILGMDILHLNSFSIDYKSRRICFGGAEAIGTALPLESGSEPYLVIKARIDDLPVSLVIDTGHEGLTLFANRLPDGLKREYSSVSRLLTVAGEAPLTQSGLGKLAAGGNAARKVQFNVAGTGRDDMGFDGILGVRALHASIIHFDFERMTVSWK
jgi:Aspartyl protease